MYLCCCLAGQATSITASTLTLPWTFFEQGNFAFINFTCSSLLSSFFFHCSLITCVATASFCLLFASLFSPTAVPSDPAVAALVAALAMRQLLPSRRHVTRVFYCIFIDLFSSLSLLMLVRDSFQRHLRCSCLLIGSQWH